MKTLIFSDTHLNLPFEEKKYNFLERIISDADQVIINGDFWDGYLLEFKKFLDSPWKNLFPLLKLKKAIYIFGNHDQKRLSSDDIKLFSETQTDRYVLNVRGANYIIEHGHRLLPFVNETVMQITAPRRSTRMVDKVERILIKKFGHQFVHKMLLKLSNQKIKRKLNKELAPHEYYICGHTHCAEVDHENRFINTGVIKHGLGQYLLIEDGRLNVKEEWYD